jgi:hypothetical protein
MSHCPVVVTLIVADAIAIAAIMWWFLGSDHRPLLGVIILLLALVGVALWAAVMP